MSKNPSTYALPNAVLELAKRLGACEGQLGSVQLRQSGELRTNSANNWMRFSARQVISVVSASFSWKARVGPFGALRVRDELIDGQPNGSVSLAGLFPMAQSKPTPELLKGELLRYLAEIPWAPDAILSNSNLNWSVPEDGILSVSTSIDDVFASVNFLLNADGLVSRVEALDRPRQEGKIFRERPWHGTFANYHEVGGRTIPFAAKVGWTVDDEDVIVWKGKLEHWQLIATSIDK